MKFAGCFLMLSLAAWAAPATPYRFEVAKAGEGVAELELSSPGSDWSLAGREAALADVRLDGKLLQNVMLSAGTNRHVYRVFLGPLNAGTHELSVHRNRRYSAAGSGLEVHAIRVETVLPGQPNYDVLAHAPILYARRNTIGLFTDVPLLMYCERGKDANRPSLQYTVIFTNEDGGTSTRALMARWGRTTDIEFIYRVVLNPNGSIAEATIQGRNHKVLPYQGPREGMHPVLIPVTDNNMVASEGTSEIRYQLAPRLRDLKNATREGAMDDEPFTYGVMIDELRREQKLRPPAKPTGELISDPRNYLFVDLKVSNDQSAVAVWVVLRNDPHAYSSHLGIADLAIEREGWVRTTVELPPGTVPANVAALAVECLLPDKEKRYGGPCNVESIGRAFFLDKDAKPQPSFFSRDGVVTVPAGQIATFPVSRPRPLSSRPE